MNLIESNGKENVAAISNVVIAYSSFIGVLSAIIYYIATIKGISILIAHGIAIFYILLALLLLWAIVPVINKGENWNERRK